MPFHGLRSRSKSKPRCKQQHQGDSLAGPQTATPRPSVDSRTSSSSLSVFGSRWSRSSAYGTPDSAPPVPLVPDVYRHRQDDAIALFPFLANLPRFSALPDEDIDLWLTAVEAVANHLGAAPDAPVPLIPLLLRGNAFKRFVKIHNNTRGRLISWEDWKNHLRDEFRPPNYLVERREELAGRVWRTTETLGSYFDQRRTLQLVALPDATEEELVDDLLSGVPSHHRRLITEAIPHAQRANPSLVILRRAMVECEVNQRGRNTLRSNRLDVVQEHRRSHSQSPSARHSLPNQLQQRIVYPEHADASTRGDNYSSSSASTDSTTVTIVRGSQHPQRQHYPTPTITITQ